MYVPTACISLLGVSNDSNENNDGIIIAAVVGVVAVVLLIMTITMCIVLFYRHNHNIKKSEGITYIHTYIHLYLYTHVSDYSINFTKST